MLRSIGKLYIHEATWDEAKVGVQRAAIIYSLLASCSDMAKICSPNSSSPMKC